MKTIVQILIDARTLLVEKGWTKLAPARDAEGRIVRPHNPSATCFCASGAVTRASDHPTSTEVAYSRLMRFIPPQYGSVQFFNDYQSSVVPVLELFDRAIASLEDG